ncbi:F-box protein SKIP8 [Apostasia shenzhenica]|uniref:F-box protein SKIP8 n=1 Tax=Apostasia shenzhenica TaxID=1088818 RepID=A0A2I0AFS5_9ASPA|nr:F-box protein SKIP8 [Apostasia shenzhenica]
MEEPYLQSLCSFLAAAATALCLLSVLWVSRLRSGKVGIKMSCSCSCSCGSIDGGGAAENGGGQSSSRMTCRDGAVKDKDKVASDRQSGVSMMEQLVPEITTHALSYLDHTSLCRLSMTNSAMRRAANDDNAWKALYQKDFTAEQDNLTPTHGWKSYYAATKAIINVNAEFCNIIRERSLPAMSRLWLHADYVKCIHSSGELYMGAACEQQILVLPCILGCPNSNFPFIPPPPNHTAFACAAAVRSCGSDHSSGRGRGDVDTYNSVMNSWASAFNWAQGITLQVRDVRARVASDMAWVTMKAYIDADSDQFFMTNVYEFHGGRWYMVHHHSTVVVLEGDPGPGQPNGFA